jgi:hypothetical protein
MDYINSQNLTHLDGYYHRFVAQGDYSWGLGSLGSYVVHVTPRTSGTAQQFTIRLQFASGMYTVLDPNIKIQEQDYVLWHNETPDPSAPPFSVVGSGFNSRALAQEDAFSHFFFLSGSYKYQISGGTGGPQQGTIQVSNAPNPTPTVVLVAIDDGMPPSPDPVAINAGDTVHWDIVTGNGLVIKGLS